MRLSLALVCLAAVACGGTSADTPAPSPVTATPTVAAVATLPAVNITFLMVAGAAPGGRASVTIRTDPVGVECAIAYRTPAGTASDAEGLRTQTTRGSGTPSWEWTISAATEPEAGQVTVTCDGVDATSEIEIGA